MVADNVHLIVKNQSYDDFRKVEDFESAEMMLFDIIDEAQHVWYGYRCGSLHAEEAGCEELVNQFKEVAEAKTLPQEKGFAPWDYYQDILKRIREKPSIEKIDTHKVRSPRPM